MKARIYAKTNDVKAILQEHINHHQGILDTANSRLEQLNSTKLYTGETPEDIKRGVSLNQEAIRDYKTRIQLLDSHGLPETLVEFDLD